MGYPHSAARTLFISDMHLGSRYCNPLALASLINCVPSQKVVIVGDFWDGWLLAKRRLWSDEHDALLKTLAEAHSQGTRIVFVPGNHDLNCADHFQSWFPVEVRPAYFHSCADGRTLYVIHGDRFEVSQVAPAWVTHRLATVHEYLLGLGAIGNKLARGMGFTTTRVGTCLTKPWKQISCALSRFKLRAIDAGKLHACDGVVCGHIHSPELELHKSFLYANTGDWLENCSALIETVTGGFELWQGSPDDWLNGRPRLLKQVVSTTVFSGFSSSKTKEVYQEA